MVKMRSNIDGTEMDVSEEEAYQLQAQGKAHSVDDANAKAKAIEQGNFSSVTGRPNPPVAEAPESLSAPGTPGQHEDEPAGDEEPAQPVRNTKKR